MSHMQVAALPSFSKTAFAGKAALFLLSIPAVTMPLLSVRTMGITSGIPLTDANLLGTMAVLVPIACAVALTALFVEQLRHFGKLIDIAAFALVLCIGLYALSFVVSGMSDLRQADDQMAQMLGSTRGFSASGMVRLTPAVGLLPALLVLALSGFFAIAAIRGRKA